MNFKKHICEGKNTNNVLDMTFISYGTDSYSPIKFKNVDLEHWATACNNKPYGGLWASPVDSKWGWADWCKSEDFHIESLNKSFLFKLKPTANIYVIDNIKDLIEVSTYISEYMPVLTINFKKLIDNNYDGIFVTEHASRALRTHNFSGIIHDLSSWDCESICIFNPNVIIPCLKENINNMRKLTESKLNKIIKESINNVLMEEDYIKYHKYQSPYKRDKKEDESTPPLKDNVSLYDIRGRISNILQALHNNHTDDAKKQITRLYKLVDALINQGHIIK